METPAVHIFCFVGSRIKSKGTGLTHLSLDERDKFTESILHSAAQSRFLDLCLSIATSTSAWKYRLQPHCCSFLSRFQRKRLVVLQPEKTYQNPIPGLVLTSVMKLLASVPCLRGISCNAISGCLEHFEKVSKVVIGLMMVFIHQGRTAKENPSPKLIENSQHPLQSTVTVFCRHWWKRNLISLEAWCSKDESGLFPIHELHWRERTFVDIWKVWNEVLSAGTLEPNFQGLSGHFNVLVRLHCRYGAE